MQAVSRSSLGYRSGLRPIESSGQMLRKAESEPVAPEGVASRGSMGRPRGRIARVLLALAMLGLWLALVSTAGASAQSFTWTGGSASTADWSSGANWAGGVAPTSSTALENLDFPQLESACAVERPTDACYESENDLSGLTVGSMYIDDGGYYGIFGEKFTLGAGGLTASPPVATNELTVAFVETPIALDASQTWSIAGTGRNNIGENQLYLGGDVTGGSSDNLKVEMSRGGALDLGGEDEVGPVAIEGAEPGEPGGVNGLVGLFGGKLNSSDREPVSLSHVFFYGAGVVGPLTSTGTELDVASGESSGKGTLDAASATLDSSSLLALEITGAGETAGVDYSHLTSPGAVELGGSLLGVRIAPPAEKKPCPSLTPGGKYTLVSTTGGLSGVFSNAPANGDEISLKFAKTCTQITQSLLIEYNKSGATQTVIGTVVGPASTTTLSAAPSNPVTNQSVTLTATVVASVGTPSGTVEFRNGGTAISGCSDEPVIQEGSSYTATCQTSFSASSFAVAGSPMALSAVFTPGAGVNVEGSASGPYDLNVGHGSTTTTLQVSNTTPQVGASVTYTATVTPGVAGASRPSGSVEFLDGGAPIGSCSSQPLALSGTASCALSYASAGTHTITALYSGDASFNISTSSPAQTVTVEAPPIGPSSSSSTTSQATPAPPKEVSLAGTSLSVRSNDVVLVKLACSGGLETCSGTLALSAKETQGRRVHRSSRTVTIGTATFTIASAQTTAVKLALNAAGRALLSAGHGQLSASLAILETGSGAQPQVRSVHLALQHSGRKARRRRK
jgi:Big-like domain-containing protein